jgi:hypothetical protein
MRSLWNGLGIGLVCLFGCTTTDPMRKPPPAVPEYVLPPSDDAKYSSPVAYPEKTLNSGTPKKETNPFGAGGPGGPGGMRGGGGGGGNPGMGTGGY